MALCLTPTSRKKISSAAAKGSAGNFALGSKRQDYVMHYTDPYFNDSKMSLGVDGFNTTNKYTEYTQKQLGFAMGTGYPFKDISIPFIREAPKKNPLGADDLATPRAPDIWDYMKGGVAYGFTKQNITNVQNGASPEIIDEQGVSYTSSMTPSINYDSRDHYFNPSEGMKTIMATKFAGLGGDNRFIKSDISGRWYYPLIKKPEWGGNYVLSLGGSLGYGIGFHNGANGGTDLPLYERFFTGGINSVRGFVDRSIGPRAPNVCVSSNGSTYPPSASGSCNAGDTLQKGDVIGGTKLTVLSAELLFPIMEQYGLRGVVFVDVGNAYDGSLNFGDFRRSIGFGGRWMSPFGPLRVELGFPLKKLPGDDTSVLGFSVGAQ